MSKLFRRKGFRLASVAYFLSLGTLAVSLFAWFSTSSTFSWFASNKEVDASGMAIQVKTDENASVDMTVYKYIQNDNGSHEFAENPTIKDANGNDTGKMDLSLLRYDQVFQEDNDYTPILLKLKLSGGTYTTTDNKLSLAITHNTDKDHAIKTVTTDSSSSESVSEDTSGASGQKYDLSNYISSVISVKAMVEPVTGGEHTYTWDSGSSETNFQTLKNEFKNVEQKYFVKTLKTVNGATETTKNASISFDLTYAAASDKICIVYVWIDYDDGKNTTYSGTTNGLINAFIDQMNDAGGSSGINISYPLYSDLTELSVVKSTSASN